MDGLLVEIPAPAAAAVVAVVLMAGSGFALRWRGDLTVRLLLTWWLASG